MAPRHGDTSGTKRRWLAWLLLLLVAGGGIAALGWYQLFREEPQHFDSVEAYYLYGSIGAEQEEGIPYWIWRVLPDVLPQHLPGEGGDAALGMLWEEGEATPVGFSKKTIGFPRIGINCAACHTASYRTAEDAERQIVPTGPHQTFDPQAYLRFLGDAAHDPDFTAATLLAAIEEQTELSWLDRLLYRFLIIPRTRDGLQEQAERFTWTEDRPRWGPGRIDPFNPVKFHPDLLALDPAEDDTIGNSDIMPLWAMDEQEGFALHWDGLNDSLTEVVLSGAIGDGARPDTLPVDALAELEAYLLTKRPRPTPSSIPSTPTWLPKARRCSSAPAPAATAWRGRAPAR